ncbi:MULTISPECIES: PDR/VanB family oxidoreductase [unclassified Pseudomonas]|uniref:PDR/VanB family oxidoreductase n=1 Tax=unclassified Pseudomonas TaxID=196821 RepID=UPI0021C91B5E|nr:MULTISPECIES: PDR/VanB family oxidoreductase [unclassified Pseudomonas]MCU1734156.1 PDR/VanB family oxidoreductase [Pseudomonas sp. 20P_3.2_Bac4]MCU1742817.1 PDR/VanB family oxidoreductase [Pseudomonas sp. 20P_3.2_Bac5]
MLEVCVSQKTIEADGVCSFELLAVEGAALPAFTAGSHVDVQVAPGVVRQYSLCNSPQEQGRYLIAVLHEAESRGGSRGMHLDVGEGARLTIGTPRNLFDLDLTGQRYLLFAGGIGITPILAMAHTLIAAGKDFELHYCGRSVQRLAFVELLNSPLFSRHLRLHVDDGPVEQRFNVAQVLASPAAGDQLYVCGPAGFMTHVQSTANACGWNDQQMHREDFAAPPQVLEGDRAFDVELARSGRVISIPASRTVLEVLLENAIDIDSSCEQGICGACMTGVLAGEPDHRDQFMTEAEHARNDRFTPCCSRSNSPRLVLDL